MNYPSPMVVDGLEQFGIDTTDLRPEAPPLDPSKFSSTLKRHLKALGIEYRGEPPITPNPYNPPPANPSNLPIPDAVVEELFFLAGGKEHEITEGNSDEQIAFVQKVLGKEQYDSDVLYEMDEEEFTTLYLRAKRVVYCGRPWRWPIGADGIPYLITYACGVWRACPRCREARIDKWKGRVLSALVEKRKATGDGRLWVIRMKSPAAARAIKSILGRKRYICFPLESDCPYSQVIITDDDSDDWASYCIDDEAMDYDGLTALDWHTLTGTPEGRRISGSLGKPKEKDDGRVALTSYSLVIKGINCIPEQDEIVQAFTSASERITSRYKPTTKGELESALFQLAMRWKSNLERIARQNDKRFHVFVGEIAIRADLTRIGLADPIRAKQTLVDNIIAHWGPDGPFAEGNPLRPPKK